MKIAIGQVFVGISVLILTACTPAKATTTPPPLPSKTAAVLPSSTVTETTQPTATQTRAPTRTNTPKPTLTLTPTTIQFPLLELLNNVKLENGGEITQTDTSLESLVWPGGIEDFAEEPYVNIPQGFQIQYPKDWVVLENPDLTVFSPDKMHTLCPQVLGIEPDQCGTPIAVAVITNTQINQYFGEMPLVKQGTPEPWFMSEYYDQMYLLEMNLSGATLYDEKFLSEEDNARFTSPQRFEINGYPAIGLGLYGGYQPPGDPAGKEDMVIGYLMIVRENDRVGVFFSMAPAKFWEQYKTLLVTMMQSFRFTAGPLPSSPPPTPKATLIPAPANQTPTADRFTFNGMELRIDGASLANGCSDAFEKIFPGELMASGHIPPDWAIYQGLDQPGGTNCLLVAISTIPGKEYSALDQLKPIQGTIVEDQNQKRYTITPESIGFYQVGETMVADMYFFVDKTATSFILILPDGRNVPINLN